MESYKKFLFFVFVAASLLGIVSQSSHSAAADYGVSKSQGLTVVNYVAGWSHDALGYHPAIYLLLENSSGQDLSNKMLRLQARFQDMQTAEVTVGRKEVRKELKPGQQIRVAIEGPRPYELPFEVYMWPNIECKVMSRIGNTGDEGTETLLPFTKLESVAHTTDEAFQALNQTSGFVPSQHTPKARPAVKHTKVVRPKTGEEAPIPLTATAHKMRGPETTTSSNKESPLTVLSRKTTPGLGDDFYNFEQCFGLPIDFDAKHSDFTWAHYRHAQSGVDMVVGSKERSGKVDLVVVSIPRSGTFDEFAIIDASKPLAGKMRTQVVGQAKRSVRYLPTGRLELVSAAASGYKVACLNPQNDDGFILIISRLPQEIDPLLSGLPTKTHLLKRLRFLEHKDVEPHRAN